MPKKKQRIDIDPDKIIDLLTIRGPWEHVFSDPKNSGPLKKIVIPKGGGIDSYIKGQKYPYPGYPDRRKLEIICIVKKIFVILINLLTSFLNKRNILKLVFIKKNIKDFLPRWLTFLTWMIRNHRLKPQFYSRPVREIYRLFDILIERDMGQKDKWMKIRDIICLVAEFDTAYRFRLQDILSEIKIDEIKLSERDYFFAAKLKPNYKVGDVKK